jgi:hypothetical protein
LLKVIKFGIIGIKCWIVKGIRSIIQLIKINDNKIEALFMGSKGPLVIDSTGIGKLCGGLNKKFLLKKVDRSALNRFNDKEHC